MARGHQKIQSQQKAQEKQAKMKKQAGHSANDQKKAAQVALKAVCSVCKVWDFNAKIQDKTQTDHVFLSQEFEQENVNSEITSRNYKVTLQKRRIQEHV